MHDADLPNDPQIDIGIVVSYNITHAAHFSEGKLGDRSTGRLGEVDGGLCNNFDAPDHGILLLTVGQKTSFRRVFQIRRNHLRCKQNVLKPSELVSFHTRRPQWRGYGRERSDWVISRETDEGRNPQERPPTPPPRPPFRAKRRRRPERTRQASLRGLHHCEDRVGHVLPSQKPPACGCGIFGKTDPAASPTHQQTASPEVPPYGQDSPSAR